LARIIKIVMSIISFTLGFTSVMPVEFEYNQSTEQAFYFIIEASIDGIPIEEGDWIAAFRGDMCVGARQWIGNYTDVPVMGDDGEDYSAGYMLPGEYPTFKIYDLSLSTIYYAQPSQNEGFPQGLLAFFEIESLDVIYDCANVLGGPSVYDDCGVCDDDPTNDCGSDCMGIWGGEAFIDDCGVCSGGTSGHEPNIDKDDCGVCFGNNVNNQGCGCFNPGALEYCYDADGDGLGFGSSVEYCQVEVPENWVPDCLDPEPYCVTNDTDDCDVCGGDNSSCSGCTDENAWNYCIDCIIEDGSCIVIPEEFNYSQSTAQAFYFVIDADVLDVTLNENEDWIGVFNGDICVGSRPWEGTFTSAPAMGDDGSEWTEGYLQNGDYPTFKIFDASENTYFETEAMNIYIPDQYTSREYNGWENFGFFEIERLRALVPDCANIVDGNAYEDECGECVGGTTGLQDGWAIDCAGECFGDAALDNCAICSGGQSGHVANSDNIGCGCFEPAPEDYWYDTDGDGLGSGEPVSLCLDDVFSVWVQNNDDLEPFCPTNNTDDCGECAGNNGEMDCAGICYGDTAIDECGVCGGDGTSCLAPDAISQSIELIEDTSLSIMLTGYDPNGYPITEYTIISLPSNGNLSGELPSVTYIPYTNYYGEDSFQFTVSTNQYTSEPAIINLTILPVNDAPIAYDIQQILDEDQLVQFKLIGFDIDGDELSFEIISGPNSGQAEIIGDSVTYIPNQHFFGIDSFDFILSDGDENSNVATSFLTINEINDLPIFESILDQEIFEGESLNIIVNATDQEDDYLVYSAIVDDNATVLVEESQFTFTPHDLFYGIIIAEISVTDGFGFVSEQFSINVIPINDAPIFEVIPSQITDEDVPFSINLSASDPDGDELVFSAESLDFASLSFVGSELTVTPNENYFGQFLAELFVSDGEYSDSVSFIVNVIPINDAPEIIFIENQNGIEDDEFNLELFAYDMENEAIIFTASSDGNSQVSIIDNFLVVIPNENYYGDINISIIASDGSATDTKSFVLSINPVNDYPEISIINDIIIDEDNSTTFRILATDIDGDSLTYSAHGADVLFEYNGDLVTVIPNENLNGVIEITAIASDNEYADSTIFFLVINEVNDEPIVTAEILDITLEQNSDMYSINLSDHFYDVENGVDLEYTVFENHPAIEADIDNYSLNLIPIPNEIGLAVITVTASDNVARAVASINFEVNVIAVNQPPVVNDMTLTTDEDSELVFILDASDESSELVISILSGPSNGEITYISGLEIAYLSDENYFGSDEIIFSISDGELSSELTVNIDIESVNDAPYFVTTALEDVAELSEFSQLIEYEDVDGENSLVDLSLVMGPSWVAVYGDYFEGSPSGSDAGIYTIMLKVDDGNDASTMEFDLTVINLNEAPVASDLYVTCEEDVSIYFSIFVSDNDGDELIYSIGEAQNGSISGSAPNLVYTPNLNFSGDDYFTFTAFDGIDYSNEGTISINVLAVNDAPTSGDAVFEVSGNEFEFDLSDYVFDLEGDELTFVSIPPSETDTLETVFGGLVTPHGDNSFTYEHPEGVSDADFLLYKVNDGSAESVISMVTFNLYGRSLSRDNTPTAFDDEVIMLEDNSAQLTLVGFDVFNPFPQDGSESISITQSPGFGSLGEIEFMPGSTTQLAQWVVEYIPADNFSGTDEIRFTVQNPNNENGQSEEGIISINISAVNDLPIFSSIESINFNEDENTVIEIQFSDVDNELILDIQENESISVQVTSSNTNSAQLYITSDDNYFGSSMISISVREDLDNGIEISQNILVVVNAINDSPVLSNISDVSINEDESITIQIDAFDTDFVSFNFEISSSDNFSTVLLGNQLTLAPSENWNGEEDFTITVEDNFGLQDSQSFNVLVLSVNDTPIANNQSYELIEDGVKLIYPSGSDIESTQLTFSISEQPTNGTVTVDGWIFTYEPNVDFNGEDSFTYVANDGENVSEPALVVLYISPVNDAPIFSDLDYINLDEDSNIDVLLSASDIDGDLLVFSIVNAESELGATLIANVISISPEDNYYGNESIVLRVTDGEYQETQSVIVNVNPINDSPIIDEVEDISINEGEGAELELSAYDIDGDDLTFSASSDDDVELSVDGTILTLLSEPNVGDSEIVINVVVSDGEYTDTETFSVFTQNLNDAPSTESLSFEINEDSQLSIAPQGSDPDGDALSFSIVSSTENGSLEFNNGLFVYSPNNNFVGTDTFTYLANDGEYDSQVSTVNIAINNVNDQPVLNSIDNQLLQEGESLELELSAEDIDGDALTYSAIADGDVVVDIIGNMLTISPLDENFNGDIGIIVTVYDGQFEDSHNFILTYSPINDIPQITSISDDEILEDAVFIYALSAIDVDGDNIEFSAEVNGNAIATVQGNILTITPNQNYNGGINATVSASDGEYTVFSSFNIQVLAVNDAPIIPVIETQNAFEDTEFQFGIEVDDIDDADHSFSVSMDTTFVSYSINGNSIMVQPMENWHGEILVSISASDDEFTATQLFIIEFESVNDSPQIVSDAIIEATEDLAYEYQMQVDDPDNDSFYFSLISAPEGMQISENGLITWLPTEGIISSGLIAIVVWDTNNPILGQDLPAYQEFIIVVESVNDAPIITSTPVITATEDEEYSYQVTASDIDSDYFTYILAAAPEGMTISNNGLIEWLPTEGVLTSDMVQVNVSDNDDVNPIISTQQFLVVVTPVNDPPIITSVADTTATTGEEYTYQVIVEDPDDDEFIFLLFNEPDEMRVDEFGLVSWIPDVPGVYGPITLAVSDGGEDNVQPVQELFIVVVEVASPLITMNFDFLDEGANLISFAGIPGDSTISTVLNIFGDNAQGLIGEGMAASNFGDGFWVGSLTHIEPTSGYWLKLADVPSEPYLIEAYPTDQLINYELGEGNNLISYVGIDGININDAIGDEFLDSIIGMIGEGMAAYILNGDWIGSLNQLILLKGYWIRVYEDMDFNWNVPEDLVRHSTQNIISPKPVPTEFKYAQSTQQAFYFVEEANIDGYDLLEDDWLIAYYNNTVIGARQWNGEHTDIPAMGNDDFDETFGYIEVGKIPEFKVFRASTGELIDMMGEEIAPWGNNAMTFVSLSQKVEIPSEVVLLPAYPNPFNPITNLSFELPQEGLVILSIYDINGRLVEELINNVLMRGNIEYVWDAQNFSSGIYFVQLHTLEMTLTQKIILVK